MSEKVKLTITVLDAETKLTFLFIGFLGQLGYSPITKKTRAKPGKISFVYERKEVKDGDF